MQSTNLQKDKLDLIDEILHTEDQNTLDFLKNVLNDDSLEFQLTEEQKNIVREQY